MGPLRHRLFSIHALLCLPVFESADSESPEDKEGRRWGTSICRFWDLRQVLEPIPCEHRGDHTIYFLKLLCGWSKLIYVKCS